MKILNRRVIFFAAIALALGIFAGALLYGAESKFAFIAPSVFLAGGVVLLLSKKYLPGALVIILVVGFVAVHCDFDDFSGDIEGYNEITARVDSSDEGRNIISGITVNGEEINGRGILFAEDLEIGDRVTFFGSSETLKRDIFDTYSMSVFNDGIYYRFTAIGKIESKSGDLTFSERVKKRVLQKMNRFMSPEDVGVAYSLFFGDRTYLTDKDEATIRGIGMSHIFALSGLHVGFLVGIICYIFDRLFRKRWISTIAVIVALVVYGYVTGFPPGLKRAAIMATILMGARLVKLKPDGLTSLSAAVFIILITKPRELFDLGFIMSAAATLGIVLFYTRITTAIIGFSHNRLARRFFESITLTFTANIFLLPISMNIFGTYASYAMLSNLLILPIVSALYSLIAVASLCTAFVPEMGYLFYIASFPTSFVRIVSAAFYRIPFATIPVPAMGVCTAFYLAAVLILSPLVQIRERSKAIICPGLIVLGIIIAALCS